MGRFVVVDGSGFLWKYHSVKDGIMNQDGEMIHGRLRFAQKVLYRLALNPRVSHVAVVFDHEGLNFRHRLYDGYKAHRDAMPSTLRREINAAPRLCEAFGFRSLCVEDVEADDVIASLVAQYKDFSGGMIISTRDKDLMQLVDDKVFIHRDLPYSPDMSQKKKVMVTSREDVYAALGVYPEQVVDYLALAGDSADGFHGVRGVGAKTVKGWLDMAGSYEALCASPGMIANTRQRKAFVEAVSSGEIDLYRSLATLKSDLPSFGPLQGFQKTVNDKAALILSSMGIDPNDIFEGA